MTTQFISIKINEHLNKLFKTEGKDYVIYCDTDSAYISLDFIVEKLKLTDKNQILKVLINAMEKDIVPFINSSCKILADRLNAFELTTEVKLEKICDKVIFKGKKRYILNVLYDEGVYHHKPELKVTGMETVRSNTPTIARKALEECFEILMNDDNEKLFAYIAKFREEFSKMPLEVIGRPSGVKGLDTYYDNRTLYKKATPMHVRASLVYNEMLDRYKLTDKFQPIINFDKIKICYLKMPNPFHENIIAIKEEIPLVLDISRYIDYHQQFEAVFLKPLRDLCSVIGWNVERIDTLEDMFSEVI